MSKNIQTKKEITSPTQRNKAKSGKPTNQHSDKTKNQQKGQIKNPKNQNRQTNKQTILQLTTDK